VPSPAATPSLDAADPRHHARGESRKLRCTDTPLGRPDQPAELAPVYVPLTSDEGSYISGARIAVTGALSTTCRATKVTRVRAAVLNDADGRARPRTTYADRTGHARSERHRSGARRAPMPVVAGWDRSASAQGQAPGWVWGSASARVQEGKS